MLGVGELAQELSQAGEKLTYVQKGIAVLAL